MPGWNEHVQEAKETAMFWHTLWKDNSSPRAGPLADVRRLTRAKYHQAIRLVKKDRDKCVANKLASALSTGKTKEFWGEVSKVRSKQTNLPCVVDGNSNPVYIANTFADNYNRLYNNVSYNMSDKEQLLHEMDCLIVSKCFDEKCSCRNCYAGSHTITSTDVKKAIKHLNSGKRDGNDGPSTDHLINSSNKLVLHISMMLSTSTMKPGRCWQ